MCHCRIPTRNVVGYLYPALSSMKDEIIDKINPQPRMEDILNIDEMTVVDEVDGEVEQGTKKAQKRKRIIEDDSSRKVARKIENQKLCYAHFRFSNCKLG